MSKRLTLIVGVLTVATSPVVAHAGHSSAPGHSSAQGPQHVSVAGTGIRTAVLPGANETRVMMGISARSGISGQGARGRFFVKRVTEVDVTGRPNLDFSGEVTCLRVVGNRAIVGGVVTTDHVGLPSNPIEGTGFLAVYVDNDQAGGGAHDESNSTAGLAAPGDVCPTTVAFPSAPFQQGNYVVHDHTR